jgi:hypothetical protein
MLPDLLQTPITQRRRKTGSRRLQVEEQGEAQLARMVAGRPAGFVPRRRTRFAAAAGRRANAGGRLVGTPTGVRLPTRGADVQPTDMKELQVSHKGLQARAEMREWGRHWGATQQQGSIRQKQQWSGRVQSADWALPVCLTSPWRLTISRQAYYLQHQQQRGGSAGVEGRRDKARR